MKQPDNLVMRVWTQEAWAFVKERSLTIEFAAGERLCRDGEAITHFIFPQNGILASLAVSETGQSIEMKSTGREGIVGLPKLFSGGDCAGDVVGLVAGLTTLVPCDYLHEAALRFPCVDASIRRYGRFAIRTLMQSVAGVRSQNAEQQIAVWLLTSVDRLAAPDIPMTHDTLAKLLGMRRATVTTTLSKLAQNGILETGRGIVHILDLEHLKPYGGQQYGMWREAFDELTEPLPPLMQSSLEPHSG